MPGKTRHNNYKIAAREHWLLELEYRALRAQFVTSGYNIDILNKLLDFARRQENLYINYLIVPREAKRYWEDARRYNEILSGKTQELTNPYIQELNPWYLNSKIIREFMRGPANQMRQFLVRSRLFLKKLGDPDANNLTSPHFSLFIAFMEKYLETFFSYLAWCFFIPSILINLGIILKHVILPSEEEQSLGRLEILKIQIARRWYELASTSYLCTCGLLLMFALGATWATPMVAIIQLGELLLSIIKGVIDIVRVKLLIAEHKIAHFDPEYIQELELQLEHLQKDRAVDFAYFLLLAIGAVLVVTGCVFAPWLPALGAGIILVVTIVRIVMKSTETYQFEESAKKEVDKVFTHNTHSFFQPKETKSSSSTDHLEQPSI